VSVGDIHTIFYKHQQNIALLSICCFVVECLTVGGPSIINCSKSSVYQGQLNKIPVSHSFGDSYSFNLV